MLSFKLNTDANKDIHTTSYFLRKLLYINSIMKTLYIDTGREDMLELAAEVFTFTAFSLLSGTGSDFRYGSSLSASRSAMKASKVSML